MFVAYIVENDIIINEFEDFFTFLASTPIEFLSANMLVSDSRFCEMDLKEEDFEQSEKSLSQYLVKAELSNDYDLSNIGEDYMQKIYKIGYFNRSGS